MAEIYHTEFWGTREAKYAALSRDSVSNTEWAPLEPSAPYYLFRPHSIVDRDEYESGWPVPEIFTSSSTGVVTSRDELVVGWSDEAIKRRIEEFLNAAFTDEEVKHRLSLTENYAWRVGTARQQLRADRSWPQGLIPFLYRPFDVRRLLYHPAIVWRTRGETMRHLLAGPNVALLTSRQVIGPFRHVFATRVVPNFNAIATAGRLGAGPVFPLYLYPRPDAGDLFSSAATEPPRRRPNFSDAFVADCLARLGLSFLPDGPGDLKTTFGPEDVFDYLYAILHAQSYRDRYAEFLKLDFPRSR